jgi:hypothetical protein
VGEGNAFAAAVVAREDEKLLQFAASLICEKITRPRQNSDLFSVNLSRMTGMHLLM